MASGPHTFVTVTVFSPERGVGNPTAIVAVRGNALPQQRKAMIAREFRYSQTAFLHDAQGPGQPRKIEVFNESGEEMPLAAHPAIATAHFLFNWIERPPGIPSENRSNEHQTAVLLTKSGPVSIFFNPARQVAACSIPHSFHVHARSVPLEKILEVQPQIQIVPTIEKYKGKSFPVVSLVKGMSFVLVDLDDSPEAFAAIKAGNAPDVELDAQWSPSIVGAYYYRRREQSEQAGEPTIHNLQARMISRNYEDPGTGGAACALACYISLIAGKESTTATTSAGVNSTSSTSPTTPAAQTSRSTTASEDDLVQKTANVKLEDQPERRVYGIQQGAEIGRLCTIAVEIDVRTDAAGNKSIVNIILSGRANYFTKGEFLGW